jgi:hypothetical protein
VEFHQKPQKTWRYSLTHTVIDPGVLLGSAIGLTVVEIVLFLAYRSYLPICGFDEVKRALRLTVLAAPSL